MKIPFYKMQGTGNDFVVFPFARSEKGVSDQDIVSLCRRKFSVGADGVIFLWKEKASWFWDFYNDDASPAEFCGNGARCALRFIAEKENRSEVQWASKEGNVFEGIWDFDRSEASIHWPSEGIDRFDLESSELLLVKKLLDRNPQSYMKCFKIGVPHLCLFHTQEWSESDKNSFIQEIRNSRPQFFKKANITWISVLNSQVVTFERGVEAETLACGSGAMSAFCAWQDYEDCLERKLNFPGGPLTVQREQDKLKLVGDAHFSFLGEVKIND